MHKIKIILKLIEDRKSNHPSQCDDNWYKLLVMTMVRFSKIFISKQKINGEPEITILKYIPQMLWICYTLKIRAACIYNIAIVLISARLAYARTQAHMNNTHTHPPLKPIKINKIIWKLMVVVVGMRCQNCNIIWYSRVCIFIVKYLFIVIFFLIILASYWWNIFYANNV